MQFTRKKQKDPNTYIAYILFSFLFCQGGSNMLPPHVKFRDLFSYYFIKCDEKMIQMGLVQHYASLLIWLP